ncbi:MULTISPECIES: ABC transporter permease [unclassified Nesterenkonia]|uniref:ABC transporter permease n=1 Tax=unclassified Nesterenkonia TaxID=2629769 RepID=UPI001F4D2510|nr:MULTISPECIES: ABC transporter permease [unclassified Nesterenkonia]MCH8561201.1 ABC transporter permease [Nesterenkonia sp. DZ6]MCH8571333.1 ABC transporter permease [Nesterenkonia sp. AY15]
MAAPALERAGGPQEPGEARRVAQLDGSNLIRVGARPGLFRYIREIWSFRHFLYYDSHSRVASANSYDSLGRVWMILNPILFGTAYFFVFGLLLQTGRGVDNFIGYLIIGVFTFRFFTTAVSGGSNAIAGNQRVVQAFNFPRACLVISTTVRELFSSIPMFFVMALLVLSIGDLQLGDADEVPISLTWHWLLFFPCIALALMVMLGWSLALARAVNAHNDVKHLISFSTRILFYTSAVFFSSDRYSDMGVDWLDTVMGLNPLFCVLDIIRHAWLYDGFADPARWIVLGSWAAGSMLIGFLIFWHGEESYGKER